MSGTISHRLRFALRWAAGHFLVSLAVAALVAGLVFWVWFPAPYWEMVGVGRLFWVILAVDMVCGPLLTLILAAPGKRRREIWVDLSLVAAIQLAALGYGLYSVALARPVAEVFEVDRIVLLSQREVLREQLPQADTAYRRLPLLGVLHIASDLGKQTTLEGLELSLQGVSPAMRPVTWVARDAAVQDQMRRQLRPLKALAQQDANVHALLARLTQKHGLPAEQIYYLPFVHSQHRDWIMILDGQLALLGHAQADGFLIDERAEAAH